MLLLHISWFRSQVRLSSSKVGDQCTTPLPLRQRGRKKMASRQQILRRVQLKLASSLICSPTTSSGSTHRSVSSGLHSFVASGKQDFARGDTAWFRWLATGALLQQHTMFSAARESSLQTSRSAAPTGTLLVAAQNLPSARAEAPVNFVFSPVTCTQAFFVRSCGCYTGGPKGCTFRSVFR